MPRFYFDVHDDECVADDGGIDLPDVAAARRAALLLASRLVVEMAGRFWEGDRWSMAVRDDRRTLLFTLNFSAVEEPGGDG